jgi:hypothetical protein
MAAHVNPSDIKFRDPYRVPSADFAAMSLDDALAWSKPQGWTQVGAHTYDDSTHDQVHWLAYRRDDACPATGARWMVARIECSASTWSVLRDDNRRDYFARMLSLRMLSLGQDFEDLLTTLAAQQRPEQGRPRLAGWNTIGRTLLALPDDEAAATRMLVGLGALPFLADRFAIA